MLDDNEIYGADEQDHFHIYDDYVKRHIVPKIVAIALIAILAGILFFIRK